MTITTGFYYIKGKDGYLGRMLAEDRSLLPKRVVTLPDREAGQSRWLLEATSNNEYKILNNGATLIGIDGMAFARLLPEPYPDMRWLLTAVDEGKNQYTVKAVAENYFLTGQAETFDQATVTPTSSGDASTLTFEKAEDFDY
ncbi:hypothetical protein BGW39_009482 [Mortierella sp. 14UC]|nr:hypothetical protein BGW39_009482 [Mortierella sp. 14UC]